MSPVDPGTQEGPAAPPSPTSTREKFVEKFDSVQEQIGRAKKAAGSVGSVKAVLADFLSPIGPITIIGTLLFAGIAGFAGYKWFLGDRKQLNDDLNSGKIDVAAFNEGIATNKWVTIFSYSLIVTGLLLFFAFGGAFAKNKNRGAIAGNISALAKVQNDILGLKKDVKQLKQDVGKLKKAGGLILSPSSASDHYHNARIYQQRGMRSKAKQAFAKSLTFNPKQVDLHTDYQSLLKDMEGISGARKVYRQLKAKYATNASIQYAHALLLEDKPRRKALEKLVKEKPDFLPALATLCKEYAGDNGANQTITDKQKEALYIKQFNTKNQGGAYKQFFFNSDNAQQRVDAIQQRQKLYAKGGAFGHMIKNPVTVTINPAGPGNYSVIFGIAGTVAKEIFYKLREDDEFKSTGFMAQKNPTTGLPYPMMYVVTRKIKPGPNDIWLKYKNAKDEIVGPIKKTVVVKTAVNDAADKFVRYQWSLPQMRRVGYMYLRGRTMITFVYANNPKQFKYLRYSINSPRLNRSLIRNGRGRPMIRPRLRRGEHTLHVQFQLVSGWKSPKLRYKLNVTRQRGMKWAHPNE